MSQKHPYWKLMRLTGWMLRFKNNCEKDQKTKGPLVTDELQRAEKQWIKLIQHSSQEHPKDVETITRGASSLEFWVEPSPSRVHSIFSQHSRV